MNPRTAFLLFHLLPACAFAQTPQGHQVPDTINLIVNGGFENYEGKLRRMGSIEMSEGWKSPTMAKADLFSDAVVGADISVPRNELGDQSPLTGHNYAGFRAWSYQNKEPRTYLMAKLKKNLQRGQKYCARYYVSSADLSKYGVNQVSAYFSKLPLQKQDESSLLQTAQVPLLRDQIFTDIYSWQGVCGVVEGTGLEAYLTIGNFAPSEKTQNGKITLPKGETRLQIADAYYYIDDVAVWPINDYRECTCAQLDKAESEFIYNKKFALNASTPPSGVVDAGVFYFKRFQRTVNNTNDAQLAALVEVLAANADIRIRLVGHMDKLEFERTRIRPDLLTLDKDRAETVKLALVAAGIAAERIVVAGVGSTAPADRNETEIALSKNRRVEVDLQK
jgi:outer membrane protein OmpA-like peptidoglycan-associated protein